jgi:lysophospholipase L1-like esterase
MVTLWLGTNDSAVYPGAVPLSQYISQMRAIILTLLSQNTPRILIITPPPVNLRPVTEPDAEENSDSEIWNLPYRRSILAKMTFAAAAVKLVRDMQQENSSEYLDRLEVVDIWRGMTNKALVQSGQEPIPLTEELTRDVLTKHKCPGTGLPDTQMLPDGWFSDGLHLRAKGYEVIGEQVFGTIEEKWPGLIKS